MCFVDCILFASQQTRRAFCVHTHSSLGHKGPGQIATRVPFHLHNGLSRADTANVFKCIPQERLFSSAQMLSICRRLESRSSPRANCVTRRLASVWKCLIAFASVMPCLVAAADERKVDSLSAQLAFCCCHGLYMKENTERSNAIREKNSNK